MRKSLLALVPILALAALSAPTAAARDFQVEVLLHELGGGTLHLLPPEMHAEVGDRIQLTVVNEGAEPHDLLVCADPHDPAKIQSTCDRPLGRTPMLDGGASAILVVEPDAPGTFEYFCTVPTHKNAGMVGTLRVTGEPQKSEAPLGAAVAAAGLAVAGLLLGRRRA